MRTKLINDEQRRISDSVNALIVRRHARADRDGPRPVSDGSENHVCGAASGDSGPDEPGSGSESSADDRDREDPNSGDFQCFETTGPGPQSRNRNTSDDRTATFVLLETENLVKTTSAESSAGELTDSHDCSVDGSESTESLEPSRLPAMEISTAVGAPDPPANTARSNKSYCYVL